VTPIADANTRDLISRDGLERTLFVEAGAGTGKTTQLVDRIANLVLAGHARLADIAAITFTEAAATELRDRIRIRFEQHSAASDDPAVVACCERAVADADLAAITTLHGFAKRILAEHPIAAGLPPRVDIVDEVSSQLAHEERWARFVDRLYDDGANEELLVRAAVLDVALEPRYPGHRTLKDVAAVLAQSWDRLGPAARRRVAPLPPIDLGALRCVAAELERVATTCTDPQDKLFVRITTVVLPAVRAILDRPDPRQALRELAAISGPTPGQGGRKAVWGGDAQPAKEAVRAVADARQRVLEVHADQVLTRLLTLVAAEVLEAAESRRAEGRLEFHDLLVLARHLLRTSPPARAALHQRYRFLLLDEFQDTDPLQIDLAVLIASSVGGQDPPGWDHLDVADGRLFFVGDPKQSIYRFRRADIGLFLEARDRFAPGGTWARLVTNFRSVPAVVEWVNALFGDLMALEVAGVQPRYEPLVAARQPAPEVDHRPVLLGGPQPPDEACPADELRAREAEDVAAAIDHIRCHPDRWAVHDQSGRWRPARLPDVTVLVPTRTSLPFLRDALAARRIPYRLDTGTLVYATQEVRDLLHALRAVDDPTDQISLVAALRSPLYACSDPELARWRQAGGRWDLRRRAAPEGLGPQHPVAVALDHLRSLWEQRWWLGPSELVARLVTERRADLLAMAHERPTEVWRRLRFLQDQARAFEEAGGGPLRAFLDWADLQASEGSRVHEPMLPETDDDAVRVMTVHGAKGLEFPITILSGMTTRPGRAHSGYRVVWDDDLPQVRVRANIATENHDPRADLEAEMDENEKLRLLYVACTRARDHLVVACRHKQGDGTFAHRVWDHVEGRPALWRRLEDAVPPPTPPPPVRVTPPATDDGARWSAARRALIEPQRRALVVSATTIAREAAGGTGAGPDGVDIDDDRADTDADRVGPEPGPAVPVRRRGRAGTAIGRAVHATLQVLDLAQPADLAAESARQAELEAVPEAAATVEALVRSALAAPVVRAAAAGVHHKEVYVAAPVGGRVIEGYVDLLVEGPDGLVIVDYKTDTVSSEAAVDDKVAAYELQGAAYAVALEETTGLAVVDCRFVFCRPGGAIERSVPDLAGACARVRDHLDT
jgi:ATP-dependent helicase/nuclease subunit A